MPAPTWPASSERTQCSAFAVPFCGTRSEPSGFCEGVYEWCVRRFDQRTGKLLSREREWFAFFDGEFYSIPYLEVLFTAWNIDAQLGAA